MTSLIDIDCLRSQYSPPAINLYISEKKQIQDQMSSSASSDEDHEEPETDAGP